MKLHHDRSYRITAVEDDVWGRQLVRQAVADVENWEGISIKLHVHTETSAAIANAKVELPEVVVMDHQSPEGGLSGWDAACEIHRISGAQALIVTANASAAQRSSQRRPLADAVIISKPAERRQVAQYIKEALLRFENRQMQDSDDIDFGSKEFVTKMADHFAVGKRQVLE